MSANTLTSENQSRDLAQLKPQTQTGQAQQKWLYEQNLMITSEELEALENYTQMIRNKLTLLKEVYEI